MNSGSHISENPEQNTDNTTGHAVSFSFERVDGNIFVYGTLETTVRSTALEVISRTQKSILNLIGQKLPDVATTDIYRFDDVMLEFQSGEIDETLLIQMFREMVRATLREYATDREIRINIALSSSIPDNVYQRVIEDLKSSSEIDEGRLNRSQGYITFSLL